MDAKETENPRDLLDMVLTSGSMQARIVESIDSALESVLNQCMTGVCNHSLPRRDTLLKLCKI